MDCMIALPGQLFYGTQIPACLWFLCRNKGNGKFRDRRGQTLFMDTRKMGYLVDRTHRELSDDEVARIANTYHAWRGEFQKSPRRPWGKTHPPHSLAPSGERVGVRGDYQDFPGFCKSATLEEIRAHGHVLTPGRYVGAEEVEDDDEPFEDKMSRLTAKLEEQFAESTKLEKAIRENLQALKFPP